MGEYFTGRKRKMAYASKNAFVNPQINRFQCYVKRQEELKQMKLVWQNFVMQEKYRIPGDDCYLLRWDVARAKTDGLEIPEIRNVILKLREHIRADFPVKHKFEGRGVELSPADRPMDDRNIPVSIADGGISTAVSKVKETNSIMVSKDVYGQLTEEQRGECAQVDGIHQYATGELGKVSFVNPTGYWVTGSGDFGYTVGLMPGVKKTYTLASKTLTFSLSHIIVPSVVFAVGTKMKEVYGLTSGRYQVGTTGVKRIGDCNGEGDDESTIRKKLEGYVLRDKRGWHGSDHTLYGPCSWKVDGIFCYLKAKNGRAELQFRNGDKWIGKSEHDIECAFEMVDDILYLLYVDVYKNNNVHLHKGLQDYFRGQLEFIVNLSGGNIAARSRTLTSTKTQDNLPHDGIVIWGLMRQDFFKEINTVDITKSMAEILMKEDNVIIDKYDEMVDGKIYEYGVEDNLHLKFIKIRDPLSKILPNMLRSVRRTLDDPNLSAIRDHHAACSKEDNKCEICKYI